MNNRLYEMYMGAQRFCTEYQNLKSDEGKITFEKFFNTAARYIKQMTLNEIESQESDLDKFITRMERTYSDEDLKLVYEYKDLLNNELEYRPMDVDTHILNTCNDFDINKDFDIAFWSFNYCFPRHTIFSYSMITNMMGEYANLNDANKSIIREYVINELKDTKYEYDDICYRFNDFLVNQYIIETDYDGKIETHDCYLSTKDNRYYKNGSASTYIAPEYIIKTTKI